MRIALTQAQCNVLFHVVNNAYGGAFEAAAARAAESNGMSREDFIAAYGQLHRLLVNADEIEVVV